MKSEHRKKTASEHRKQRACIIFQSLGGSPVDWEYNPEIFGIPQIDNIDQETLLLFTSTGTQRIVSVNYLFGRPLIPHNFLKGIFTSSVRDMGNLRRSVFGLIKIWFRVPKKGQLRFSERKKDLRFSGNGQKCPSHFEKTQVPLN